MQARCPGDSRRCCAECATLNLEALISNTNKTNGLLLTAGSESSVGGLLK